MVDYDADLKAAKERVAAFDKMDGFQDRELKTIWASLEAGLRRPETGAAFDALVMLEDLINNSTRLKRDN